jgi:1-acyl-sn-glycerol-3-phosphate acyltransferase
LIRAKPGISYLAALCDSPLLPVVHYGQEAFSENIKRLKRTPMKIKVGRPFKVLVDKREKDKEIMQAVADAIMMEIASLLPEKYRGVYADGTFEREKYLTYLD